MKKSIVTGAAGFVGYYLIKILSAHGYHTYSIVRPHSVHNERLSNLPGVELIEMDLSSKVLETVALPKGGDYFFNLLWQPGGRYDFDAQMGNAMQALKMAKLAAELGCKRFVGIGSQAEYGATKELMSEDLQLHPFCAYGMAKVAACYLTKQLAAEANMEWVWGRIFSIYGQYEPEGRMLPYLLHSLRMGNNIALSSCNQNWDFLHGKDAGEALLALAERGRCGEIYNIADGRYRKLKDFVEEAAEVCGGNANVNYGHDPVPFVSLQPVMDKLKKDTGWEPHVDFADGVKELVKDCL